MHTDDTTDTTSDTGEVSTIGARLIRARVTRGEACTIYDALVRGETVATTPP